MILWDFLVFLHLLKGVFGNSLQEIPEDSIVRYVDQKDNVTLPCLHGPHDGTSWVYEGNRIQSSKALRNGSLLLYNVTRQMNGFYVCRQESSDKILSSFNLVVRGPPDPPQNVSIHPSTVIAIIKWTLHLNDHWEDSPEGPKTTFHLRYRQITSTKWTPFSRHIAPNQNLVEVYNLTPNSTYGFQLWTSNSYGNSDIVSINATTLHDVAEIELARMLEENMKGFSPRVWIVAVVVVLVVITISGLYLLVDHFHQHKFSKSDADDYEGIELVTHIIENPGYQNLHNHTNHNSDSIHESLLSSAHSRTALV